LQVIACIGLALNFIGKCVQFLIQVCQRHGVINLGKTLRLTTNGAVCAAEHRVVQVHPKRVSWLVTINSATDAPIRELSTGRVLFGTGQEFLEQEFSQSYGRN